MRVSYSTVPLINSNLKEPLPTLLKSKVIYLYKCLCGKRYVGRTEQRLGKRIREHVPAVIRSHNPSKARPNPNTQGSAIGKHLCESSTCADAFTTDWFSVLATSRSSLLLQFLEATYIASMDPILCRQKSFVKTLQVCSGI